MPAIVENVGKTIGNCTTSVTYHPQNVQLRTQNVELRTFVLLVLERARLRA
jgi:hypothetical protein